MAIPSAIKVFNWTATLYKGSISFEHADAVRPGIHRPVYDRRIDGFVSGRDCASMCMLHDTYFVIAHFHYIMVGGMVMAYMGGAALLVAENDRPNVSTKGGLSSRRLIDFHRL